jgi:hypothetical protein
VDLQESRILRKKLPLKGALFINLFLKLIRMQMRY